MKSSKETFTNLNSVARLDRLAHVDLARDLPAVDDLRQDGVGLRGAGVNPPAIATAVVTVMPLT